ncbi:conjugal transfer protein TrbH [Lautropia mirabilis]
MKRFALTSILAMTLVGCALTSPEDPYGDHLGVNIDHDELAKGSVATLVTLYPPAKTKLVLQQKAADPFGVALLKRLRERGYAIEEPVKKSKSVKTPIPRNANKFNPLQGPEPEKKDTKTEDQDGLPFRYILASSGPDLYHLTIIVGNQSLARPFLLRDGHLVAAGAWVRKE